MLVKIVQVEAPIKSEFTSESLLQVKRCGSRFSSVQWHSGTTESQGSFFSWDAQGIAVAFHWASHHRDLPLFQAVDTAVSTVILCWLQEKIIPRSP